MRKPARPVVWEAAGAQPPSPDPIHTHICRSRVCPDSISAATQRTRITPGQRPSSLSGAPFTTRAPFTVLAVLIPVFYRRSLRRRRYDAAATGILEFCWECLSHKHHLELPVVFVLEVEFAALFQGILDRAVDRDLGFVPTNEIGNIEDVGVSPNLEPLPGLRGPEGVCAASVGTTRGPYLCRPLVDRASAQVITIWDVYGIGHRACLPVAIFSSEKGTPDASRTTSFDAFTSWPRLSLPSASCSPRSAASSAAPGGQTYLLATPHFAAREPVWPFSLHSQFQFDTSAVIGKVQVPIIPGIGSQKKVCAGAADGEAFPRDFDFRPGWTGSSATISRSSSAMRAGASIARRGWWDPVGTPAGGWWLCGLRL